MRNPLYVHTMVGPSSHWSAYHWYRRLREIIIRLLGPVYPCGQGRTHETRDQWETWPMRYGTNAITGRVTCFHVHFPLHKKNRNSSICRQQTEALQKLGTVAESLFSLENKHINTMPHDSLILLSRALGIRCNALVARSNVLQFPSNFPELFIFVLPKVAIHCTLYYRSGIGVRQCNMLRCQEAIIFKLSLV